MEEKELMEIEKTPKVKHIYKLEINSNLSAVLIVAIIVLAIVFTR